MLIFESGCYNERVENKEVLTCQNYQITFYGAEPLLLIS